MSKQEYIVFSLSGEEFGLEIKAVREIVESQKLLNYHKVRVYLGNNLFKGRSNSGRRFKKASL